MTIKREDGMMSPVGGRGIRRGGQRAPSVERFGRPTSDSIPTIVRLFKSATTKRINMLRGTSGAAVWQCNDYEHDIRDGESLDRIRRYILANPARWPFDRENPRATRPEPEDAWARP